MAWKWFWNTETKYYDKEITRDTDWGGDESTEGLAVSGGRVQEWLKNEINGKFGVIRISNAINEQNFYSLEMFANKEDEALYDEDNELYKDRMTSVVIPISTVQGDSYSALLNTNLPSADIVVTNPSLVVPLNFRGVRITSLDKINMNARGTLTIQRSTDNGTTFNEVGRIPNALPSEDYANADKYIDIDLGGYLTQGKQLLRVRASFDYEDENSGTTKTMNSSWVLVGSSVTRTELKLELRTNYEIPLEATDVNGNANPFSVMYTVYGSVLKTHYVKIDNGTPITYVYDASVDSINRTVSADVASYMTHGVHKVESWLECQDGLGNTLKSDVLVNRFMVVNDKTSGADLTKPYLLLQNVDSEVDNFVQTEIAEYAVYSPSGESIDVAFLLTGYTEDYETSKPEEYYRLETKVEPRKPYSLLTTIEIETEDEGSHLAKYDTYFRVRRITASTNTDFMKESTGETAYYVAVDNSNAFTPVSGATFLMNPKVRNNGEDNPKRILNAKNNNAEVESVWTNFGFINDGWMTAEDGQKVLRVMAGSTLEIKKNVWAQFLSNPNSSMTFEIDFKIDNVTNLTAPIVQMFEGTASSFKGLCMNALEGWVMNGSNQSRDNCLFSWQEGVRTHLSINLNHQVVPNKGDVNYTAENANLANGTLALVRVLMNGDCVREMTYKVDGTGEWGTSLDGSIIIGNEGSDIDIYSIRIYENKQLDMTDILNRNYLASLPTAEEKLRVFNRNNLLESGRISLTKAQNAGLNCMIWHGVLPYHGNTSEQTGWMEYWRYDDDGNYLPELSGTNCKETKSLVGKGQGSTAKTYYDWNLQEDNSKIMATIQVAIDKIHPEIKVGTPYTGEDGFQYVDMYGGHLGKNAPIEIPENAQPYPYANGMVTVPDGWIDGNGMYRGMGYRVAEGTSLAQKKVIKINYASSMQSHLIGACNTYDLLHRKVVGDTPLQQVIPDAVSAKRTEPFMFFNQEGSGNVYFKGMGTYGAGKADKVTWGYVKKQMPMYALIEGSDNNLPMTGFRVPFDKNTAVYDVEGEGWLYNGQQSFDFDLGATDDNDVPTQEIFDKWADIHNFIYLHSTNLKYFNGTFEEFLKSDAASDTNYKYWFTQGSSPTGLARYDFIAKEWVAAGLLNSNGIYRGVTLSMVNPTKNVYNKWVTEGSGDFALLNERFKEALVSHMRKYLKYFINEKSLQFNYCYVLGFLAGTDNSDKNTYYKIMPYAESVEEDSEFSSWFSLMFGKSFDYTQCYQLYFDGDDMDSIFRTNNNSHQTKPYYIDRLHPYAEGSTTSLYEGMGNQLFNYVEKAYEGTNELASVMKEILNAATELMSDDDKLYGLESGKKSLWGFLHKYFFNIQHYFPQIAYMEQARIRYEFPKLLGFISSGGGARSIDPITQSLGSQLQNELQYMNQRVIYMTSYAGFGAWGGDTTHSIGLGDANETFSFTPAAMPDGSASTYTFTIKTHQYIYPSYFYGGTFTNTHQRTAPSGSCTFTIAENVLGSDTGMGICGINYISDLGDFGDKSISSNLVLNGKRVKQFISNYQTPALFRPTTIEINSRNITRFAIGNVQVGSLIDLSKQIRLQSIYTRGSIMVELIYPESTSLSVIEHRNRVTNVNLKNIPNLIEFDLTYFVNISIFTIGKNVPTSIFKDVVFNIYRDQKDISNPPLQSIHVENINWTEFDVEALSWLADRPTCELKGTIAIKEDGVSGVPRVTWDLKNKFNAKFGNVDVTNNSSALYKGLLLKYTQRDFIPENAVLKGNFYTETNSNEFKFELRPSSIYENTQMLIQYADTGDANANINSNNGVLSVRSLNNYETFHYVWANVRYLANGVQSLKTNVGSKTIEIWNRPAQLGDLVYADGTFSSAATYDGEKTPIGLCFWVGKDDGTGKYVNPNDKQKRLMVALEETKLDLATGTTSALQWGCMTPISGESDSWHSQYALYDMKEDGTKVNITSASAKVPNVYNIQSIVDIYTRGLTNPYIDPNPETNPSGESDYRDLNTQAAVKYNDGFKLCEPSTAIGDGFAYNETSTQVKDRTLTDELASLAGSGYSTNDLVNRAYAKTLKVIAHRNALLSNDIIGADNAVLLTGGTFELPRSSGSVSEMESLATLIDNIRAWATNTLEDAYPDKWSQLAYPFVSACYAYEPEREWKEGEVLADKFKAHNWFAPTEGLLTRICWFVKYGEYGEMDVFKDAKDKGYVNFSSYHWSVTEYGTNSTWFVNFFDGSAGYLNKNATCVGRAISSF